MKTLLKTIAAIIILSALATGGYYLWRQYQAGGIEQALLNLEYTNHGKLTDGRLQLEAPAGVSNASDYFVEYESGVVHDFNADGKPDAAVILVERLGGTGTFRYLEFVLDQGSGRYANVAEKSLGDRVPVQGMKAEDGKLYLDLLVHGPNDPGCCPTKEETREYELQPSGIIEKIVTQ